MKMLQNDFRSQFVNPVKSTPAYGDLVHRNKITVVKGMYISGFILTGLLITKLEKKQTTQIV